MRNYRLYWITVVVFFLIMFILPVFSFEGYSIIANTTSHLGAQQSPFNVIMNLGFIALGIITGFYTQLKTKSYPVLTAMLYVFSMSLIGVAIFEHYPLTGESGNLTLDAWHSFFATLTGFSFSMVALIAAFVLEQPRDRLMAITLIVIAIVIPLLMFNFSLYQGLFQRFMFISAFIWIGLLFSALDKQKTHEANMKG